MGFNSGFKGFRLINTCLLCPSRAVPWPREVAFRSAWSEHGMGTAWHVWISLYCQHLGVVNREGKFARILYFSGAVLHCFVSPKQDSGVTVYCSVFVYLCFRNPKPYGILGLVYYSRIPFTRTLVIRVANYPDRLGPSGKFVVNSTKLTYLEITGYRIKYSAVLWLLELLIRRGRKV